MILSCERFKLKQDINWATALFVKERYFNVTLHILLRTIKNKYTLSRIDGLFIPLQIAYVF